MPRVTANKLATKSSTRGKSTGGKGVSESHPPVVGVPNWLVPIIVNIIVLVAGVAGTWFTMQGDVSNIKTQISGLNATTANQSVRLDGMIKEQERVTRLEERLVHMTGLLQEIRADLRDNRYPARREGGLTSPR